MAKNVSIVGLGYVGLPTSLLCAEKGFRVKGLDVDRKKTELILRGKSPIKDKRLERKLKKFKGKILATTNGREALQNADIVIVAVPTPVKKNKPDLKPLKNACKTVSSHMKKGTLVIIESTIYPSTTRKIVLP